MFLFKIDWQSNCKIVGVTIYMVPTGFQITKLFYQKLPQILVLCQQLSNLESFWTIYPRNNKNSHSDTFITNHDSISSKWIAKQQAVTQYRVTPGGKYPHFHKKYPKYWYYMYVKLDSIVIKKISTRMHLVFIQNQLPNIRP